MSTQFMNQLDLFLGIVANKLKIIYCGLLKKLKVLATQDNIAASDQMQIGRELSKQS